MAVNDPDLGRMAAAQVKTGRPPTPEDVAALLGRKAVQLRLDLSDFGDPAVAEAEPVPEVIVAPAPRRRGRPPKARPQP